MESSSSEVRFNPSHVFFEELYLAALPGPDGQNKHTNQVQLFEKKTKKIHQIPKVVTVMFVLLPLLSHVCGFSTGIKYWKCDWGP